MLLKVIQDGYNRSSQDIEPQDNRDSLVEYVSVFGKLIPRLYESQLVLKIEMMDLQKMKKVQDELQ
jgi:hypothetical protein